MWRSIRVLRATKTGNFRPGQEYLSVLQYLQAVLHKEGKNKETKKGLCETTLKKIQIKKIKKTFNYRMQQCL